MATLNGRPRRLSVNYVGLGNDPTIAVGSFLSFVALSIVTPPIVSVLLANYTPCGRAAVNQNRRH